MDRMPRIDPGLHSARVECARLDAALPLYKEAFRNTEITDEAGGGKGRAKLLRPENVEGCRIVSSVRLPIRPICPIRLIRPIKNQPRHRSTINDSHVGAGFPCPGSADVLVGSGPGVAPASCPLTKTFAASSTASDDRRGGEACA